MYRESMTKKIDGRGRPKKPPGEKRSEWIGAAVTPAEKRDFRQRARAANVPESGYLRKCAGFDPDPKK